MPVHAIPFADLMYGLGAIRELRLGSVDTDASGLKLRSYIFRGTAAHEWNGPDGNVLAGYVPSYAMDRVLDEAG